MKVKRRGKKTRMTEKINGQQIFKRSLTLVLASTLDEVLRSALTTSERIGL